MEKRCVLVTGITGRSGRRFLERLNEAYEQDAGFPFSFKAVVRVSSDMGPIMASEMPIETICGDLKDPAFVRRALDGVDILFHISGIRLSLMLIEKAVEAGVKRLICVHTTGIYSKYKRAGSDYLIIEESIGKLLEDKDVPLTILRPTMIFGSLDDKNISVFIKMVDKLRVFPVVNGARYALQPVHQRDLADAFYRVLTNPSATNNKNYDLSGAYPIDLIDILKEIETGLNKRILFVPVPFFLVYFAAWALYCLTFKMYDFREKVQRLVEPRAYDHADAARDFGYAPSDFKENLQNEVKAYMQLRQ